MSGLGIIPIPILVGAAIATGAGLYFGRGPIFGEAEPIPEPSPPPAPPAPQTREELTRPELWAERMPERTVEQWQAHEWAPANETETGNTWLIASLVLAGVSGVVLLRG